MINQALKMMWKNRTKQLFLLVELFLAVLILFIVFSFMITKGKQYLQPLGFESKHLATVNFWFESLQYEPTAEDSLMIIQAKENIKRDLVLIEGIDHVSFSGNPGPFGGSTWQTTQEDDDEETVDYKNTHILISDEDFDDVYKLDILEGEWISKKNLANKYIPIVVNKKFKDLFMTANNHTIGDKLIYNGNEYQISGVIHAFKYKGEFSNEHPIIFPYLTPHSNQTNRITFNFDKSKNPYWEKQAYDVLLKHIDNSEFIIQELDENRKQQSKLIWIPIIAIFVLCMFLIINIAIGLFGVLQYTVNQRRAEIGLRKALGASKWNIQKQFVVEMILLASFPIFLAIVFALQAPLLKLFDVSVNAYWTALLFAIIFVYALVIICSLFPATIASKLEPANTLHEE